MELLATALGHPGDLGRETLDVLGLLHEKGLGDEQGELHVLVAGPLDHVVESALGVLPEGEAVGTDHHAARDRGVIGELRTADHVDVPAVEVLALGRDLLGRCLGHRSAEYRWRATAG